MSRPHVDTNVLIRYVTQDHPDHARRARDMFDRISGGALEVSVSEAVVIEAVQVFSSKALYALPRPDVQRHLTTFLLLDGVHHPHKRTFIRALDLYASINVDFIDALIVAHMERERAPSLISFDRDFDRVPGVQRIEP
jgi:predicted nucleic acid-binding protein